ncbi:MAG: class III poly(R)-hydroxyalkanoic acid synthase subunit PhaE [Gammaproteobacteria bacterium]|nr:class III poly(R)-hydroxyalkanoic acid synthase subunit PhaE [Gammaproteobacteria bacterium]NIN60975.1 class III poly(R)-hydroxyalkanoic acid synthase subunit PhaE [Gammaproteobacteria bacterium]NIO62599.1 class III poly(R)-hydroxyalkanoic acid synthase subunit PhaE [Gammaproteobacteria bacterium]NIP49484.1 class III poly(R)-hydroxyalkanoic acid synthase subunit PhaE [Gammaproteobacteria bacterium]NIQ10708.1 class III poly(R)-hydroxyalkanoic acid synthase subunit PhaE [Gammaproteobacteria ba
MSKKDTSSSWTEDWMKTQRQYLDAMSAFHNSSANSTENKTNTNTNPMAGAMDFWWQTLSPKISEENLEFIDNMAEQGRVFYALSEQFINLLKAINEAAETEENWENVLTSQFDALKSFFTDMDNGKNVVSGMMNAWSLLPMDTLQRSFSSGSIMPGDFLEDLKPEALEEVTDKFLSIPGVGYTRESQENIQNGIRLWNKYQNTHREYNNAMFKVGIRALDNMREKIVKMSIEGKEIKSMREIYDIWVDCNEDAYSDYVFTEEYSDLYGKLTNALMAVKLNGQNIVDEFLKTMNIPTRHSMNTTNRRQQQLRREHKQTIKKLEDMEDQIKAMQAGIVPTRQKSVASGGNPLMVVSKKKPRATKKKTAKKKIRSKKTKSVSGKRKKSGTKSDKIVIKL